LTHLDISLKKCTRIQDKSAQSLLESISKLSNLKELRLNFRHTNLTDEAFFGLVQVFDRLPKIEIFSFESDRCGRIQGRFVKPLADLIIQKKSDSRNVL